MKSSLTSHAQDYELGYRPELDGVRGIAVLLVVAGHVFGFRGGAYLGVDIFFVLSGFLITKLLLSEKEKTGTVDLLNFYARRFLRLTPALWLLIFICVPIGMALKVDVLKPTLLSVTYTMNWFLAFSSNELKWLDHTWSLACEEQFYLLWPAVFMLLTARSTKNAKLFLISVFLILGVWRGYLTFDGAGTRRLYFAFDTHADGLLIGCLLAMLPAINLSRYAFILSAVALIAICFAFSSGTPPYYYFGLPLIAITSAIFILGAYLELPEAKFLSNNVLVYTGKISYGIYLWHYPIYLFFRSYWHSPFYKVGVIILTLAFASLFISQSNDMPAGFARVVELRLHDRHASRRVGNIP